MAIELLDDKTIKSIKGPKPGAKVTRHSDGGGLWLRVTKRTDKAGVERVSKSWEFYFTVKGKTSCTGLGPYAPTDRHPGLTLAEARDKAVELRRVVKDKLNPVELNRAAAEADAEAERAKKIEQARTKTFASAVEDYLEKKDAELDSARHRQIWRSSFVRYAVPIIGDMAVSEISREDILRVLNQPLRDLKSDKPLAGTSLWSDRTETASRLRNRLEAVLSAATVAGYRSGDNPAAWKGNLEHILPSPTKLTKNKKENQPALAVTELPTWFAELRKREGMGARALEFATLVCARSGEVRGMTWDEVHDLDGDKPMWVIGKERTKTATEYRVPLAPQAVKLLKALPRMADTDLVFFAPRGGQLSDMTISKVMKTMHEAKAKADGVGWIDPKSKRPAVPHGTCRSTPRQWFAETGVDRDLAEMMLGHQVSSAVERAYQRSDMIERRRALAAAWAAFAMGQAPAENVVPLRGAV